MKILAATDFSEEGHPVLDFTANLARQCGGKMYLLHAVEPCLIDAAGSMPARDFAMGIPLAETGAANADDDVPDYHLVLQMADKRAKELATRLGAKWEIPIYGKAEEADDIVECVHDFCRRHAIDMLVIGNRHHTLLTSILLGNTAEKLVRAAEIPVTVVPCGPKAR